MTNKLFIRLLLVLITALSTLNLLAQNGTIKGRITDSNGEPLLGVNVVIQGSTQGIVSDLDGYYTLTNVSDSLVQLEASFIGYLSETVSIALAKGATVTQNISLIEDITQLSDVVIIGYGTTKKSDLTGAVSTVSAEELGKRAVPTVDQALQGMAAGVEISSSTGSPGATPTIRIRGIGTINNSDPIFVVDGLIMSSGAINFLNPNDIENISVLKDASASAIYGSKAANGVIMITTKKGEKGDVKVSLNSYYGIQEASNWIDLMNGPDWTRARNQTSFSGEDIYDADTVTTTNWLDEISRRAPMKNTNISFSGGSDKANYLVSYGHFDQEGIIKRTNFNRNTLRVNTGMEVKKWLRVGQNLQLSMNKREFVEETNWYNGVIARAIAADPITPIRGEDGEYAPLVNGSGNPVARLEEGLFDRTSKDSKIVGNMFAEFTIIKGLTFKSTFGGELDFNEYKSYIPAYYFGPGDAVDLPQLYQNFGKNVSWQWENYATYTKTLGIHDFTLMAGTSASLWEGYTVEGQNKIGPTNDSESLEYFDNFSREGDVLTGSAGHQSNYSLLGRLSYKLLDRYLLTSSIRRDGSSSFGDDYKVGYFPSFALAWKLNHEPFLRDIKFISNLKLRGGWGEIGNDKIGLWSYVGTVVPNLNYSEGNNLAEGATTLKPANPSIRWETTQQTNLGFDASFFRNRLEINGDYFIRNTMEMLSVIEAPLVSGIPATQSPAANIGQVRNKGFEISASFRKMEGDFNFEIGGHFSKVVNKVIDLGGPNVIITAGEYGQGISPLTMTREGLPIASFFGYVTDGVFQNYEEVNAHAFQNANTAPGDFRFKDLNGDGKITSDDQTIIGSPHPDFTYGFNLFFSYKNIDISSAWQAVVGVDILAPYMSFTHNAVSGDYNFHNDLNDSWTEETPSEDTPRIPMFDVNQNLRLSDYYIHDGSYLRMKNLQIGYNLPSKLMERAKIDKLRVYVGGQNLLTFTKYIGNDPEIGTLATMGERNDSNSQNYLVINADIGNVPQPRILTFGFDLNF